MSNKPNRRPSPAARARATATPASSSRLWWIGGGVAIAIAAALVIALLATRTSDNATTTIKGGGTVVPKGELVYGDVRVDGSALPEQPDGSPTDPAVGRKAPALSGEQFNGAPLSLPAAGKPAVVMFVAHWCPHCQKEVPEITRWLVANGMPSDVNLYAVATGSSDQSPNYPPADWLNREGWPVPTIADDNNNRAATAYGIGGFPYFVAIDAGGNVVQRASGELTTDQFQALLDKARTAPVTNATTSGSTAT
jgi:thiol-disulfide isomerase/thioredoxin